LERKESAIGWLQLWLDGGGRGASVQWKKEEEKGFFSTVGCFSYSQVN
jgi:hypothetical protein